MAEALLSVTDLAVERGGRIVLSRLSFTLEAGEVLLVSGRNGAGKSTLLRTISGLLQQAAGDIAFGLATEEVRGVETVHYLGYEDALKSTLTVHENLAFWADMLSGAADRITDPVDALAALGIGRLLNVPAGYLSAGQKRRLALARLLLAPRPLWLLDEPLIALDTAAQAQLTSLMAAHLANGGAILVASHQPLALPHRELGLASQPASAAA